MAETILSTDISAKEENNDCQKEIDTQEEDEVLVGCTEESLINDEVHQQSGEDLDICSEETSQQASPSSYSEPVSNIFEPEINIEFTGNEDHFNSTYQYESNQSDEDYEPRKGAKKDNRERKYQCPLCGKYFLTSSAMNGHVAKGHGTTLGMKFTCHVCGAPGSSRASLKRHLIRTHKLKNVDHPELLTKKCSHCELGFSSHLRLYEHIRSEHKQVLNQYHHCAYCPALMRAKASLQRHIRRAHPGKEEPFLTNEKCPLCEETFTSRPFLQKHMKTVHPDSPRHVCPTCNAGFKFPYMLSKHMISHEDPKKYEEVKKRRKYTVSCEYCDRKFGSKPRLEYHVEVAHTNPPIKIYTCRMCGLTFPTAKQNNRHYRKVHRPERQKIHCGKCNITFATPEECSEHRALHPNTCEICQKQFLRRDSLREHLLIHSAPRHQCPHCSKKFTQRSNLKRHIRVHTGEKPYKCPYCTRCFSDKSACNSHVRVHTGYERSVCTVCGASFSKKQRLNYHMRIHTGEGLLYCPLCMRPSTNSYSLRKHIESHQQPLTKALISVGFKPLLVADPNFVIKALQALTHATLRSMSRHENIPNSFIEELEEMGGPNSLLGGTTSLENDVDECADALSDIAKIETERFDAGIIPPQLDYNESDDSPFSLAKFLQSLLEKESQRIRNDRSLFNHENPEIDEGKNHLAHLFASLPTNSEGSGYGEDDENDVERGAELPETIGDELVKQCLEIIMKDEESEEDDDDEDEFDDSGMAIKTEPDEEEEEEEDEEEDEDDYVDEEEEELDPKSRLIKKEKTEGRVERTSDESARQNSRERSKFPSMEEEHVERGAPDEKPKTMSRLKQLLEEGKSNSSSKGLESGDIPKIKISRVAKSNKNLADSDIFVAEIVKEKN